MGDFDPSSAPPKVNEPGEHDLPEIVLKAFADLPHEGLNSFLRLGYRRFCAPDEFIIVAGDVPEGLGFLLSGTASVEREGYQLREFEAGVAIGEGSLVRDQPPSVSIRAVTAAEVFVIPRLAARAHFHLDPGFGVALLTHLMRSLFERLEMTNRLSADNHELVLALQANNQELQTTLSRLSEANEQLNGEVAIRKRVEDENRSLARLASDSPAPVMRVSNEGVLLYANMPSLPIMSRWRVAVHGHVHQEFRAEVLETQRIGQPREVEFTVGDQRYVFTMVPIPDAGHVNIYGRDVTDERVAAEHMTHLANHDVLTGLPNRKRFLDRLSDAMAGEKPSGAVFFLDLDHFKEVNDTLGHLVGDQLLQTVARRLLSTVRKSDLVARLGGDEFAILMAGAITAKPAEEHAQRIIKALARPFQIDSNTLHIGVSIGIAFFTDGPLIVEDAVRNADLAMYRAKTEGRNTYRFFQPDYDLELRRRLELEADIRNAISDNEFQLHFQPKVDIDSDRIIGAEALIRWRHPKHGPLGPGEFIPAAERSGLIVPLGDWVIRQACAQLREWSSRGMPPLSIAVNLSPIQLKDDAFLTSVKEHWEQTGLDPSLLEFEITESVVMHDVDHSMGVMRHLSNMGFGLSIDDFGTGYSSLSYLRRFPIDKIKIDKSFVTEMTDDNDAAAIVGTIIGLGRSLNLGVVAEGVETTPQLNQLKRLGCDEGQGYLFSRPLPVIDFESLLSKQPNGAVGHA